MKKILSLVLIVTVIASMLAVFSLHTSAADSKTLTITCRGETLAEVPVGSEFIFRVGINSGGYTVNSADGEVRYDSNYVQVVEHGTTRSNGQVDMNAYSFPTSILNTSLMSNFTETKNQILYNFVKFYNGIGVYSDVNAHYFKVRFKAIAPGTTEVKHYFHALYHIEGKENLRLIYNTKPNDKLDPIPYSVETAEPAAGYVGDADGDWQLTVMDATFIQYLSAGRDSTYNPVSADVNGDGEVNLRDALNLLRYRAKMNYDGKVGEWIFLSEQ